MTWEPIGNAAARVINYLERPMPDMLWRISIWTEIPDAGPSSGREVNLDIYAKTGKSALIKAISEFEAQSDELIHDVHISRPEELPMTDTTELIAAVRGIMKYLKASTDHRDFLLSIRKDTKEQNAKALEEYRKQDEIAPADRLRKEADEMEARDAAIIRFRNALAALGEEEA